MAKITVFGIMVADMVARVEEFPKEGETILGSSLNVYLGGKGINQAVAAKRLGGDVEMIGCVGKDGHGETFLSLLDSEGIERRNVIITEKVPTGVAQIQINDAGQNKIVVIPSANHEFGLEEVEKTRYVFDDTEYALFQLEMRYEVTERAIEYAHAKGVKVIFNPAPARKLPQSLIEKCDYITPNEVELGIIAEEDTSTEQGIIRAAEKLIGYGAKNVIATLGDKGALIANSDGVRIIKGYHVENVVDTVAAGDSFNGAFAVKIAEGASVEEAVKFANAMGALTVQRKGAIPSLRRRDEVEKFIAENDCTC